MNGKMKQFELQPNMNTLLWMKRQMCSKQILRQIWIVDTLFVFPERFTVETKCMHHTGILRAKTKKKSHQLLPPCRHGRTSRYKAHTTNKGCSVQLWYDEIAGISTSGFFPTFSDVAGRILVGIFFFFFLMMMLMREYNLCLLYSYHWGWTGFESLAGRLKANWNCRMGG